MAEKQYLKVSPTLADDAQFRSVADIPSAMLSPEYTIQLFAGSYSAITVNGDDLTLIGIGSREEVVVSGFVFGNTSTGTINIENMTVEGVTGDQEDTVSAIEVLEEDSTVSLICRDLVVTGANVGINNHGSGTVRVERVNLTGTDKAVLANAAMTFVFSELTANAYGEGNNAQIQLCTVTACHGGGSNGATTTETIVAVIS